ncbi:hypothetical protein Rsub_06044 [Raphidocelis subcapitata]|uniref:Uncharacterized protein n=1 Tax=Raphidocelis subcapitata TaxID=307507 RepID=A0A2V0P333_9CHLO|nr:hypothetical protein Rsub_06044 [Raphidocelis subcapitata]|eukprot:GBF93312.1 hypothetical protein Rsub_06044 [Raphidocelis subcapitata]
MRLGSCSGRVAAEGAGRGPQAAPAHGRRARRSAARLPADALGPRPRPERRAERLRTQAASGGGGGLEDGSELDVAVFRFTLGIPGFDDSLVPRFVGAGAGALLALNHALSAQPVSDAQGRAEFLGALLVALCLVVPEIEERLKSILPGRGRQAGAVSVEGSARVFALDGALPEAERRELAWLSFAALKNANACGVALLRGADCGRAVVARGAVGSGVAGSGGGGGGGAGASGGGGAGDGAEVLQAVAKDVARGVAASPEVAAVARGAAPSLWLPDRAAMARAGADGWACVPRGAQSLLLQAVPGGGLLILMAERPRGLPDKDRRWAAALAAKL